MKLMKSAVAKTVSSSAARKEVSADVAPEDFTIRVGEHESEHHSFDSDPVGCEALCHGFDGVWQECFTESRCMPERARYLELLGWSWVGRKMVDQIGEQVSDIRWDKNTHCISVTPKLTPMIRQVQKIVGAPAMVPMTTTGEIYEILDWPAVRMACSVRFDVKRRTLIIRKRLIAGSAPRAGDESINSNDSSDSNAVSTGQTDDNDDVAAHGSSRDHGLKHDYEGCWEQSLSEDGDTIEVRMKNSFTHRTKPDKQQSADWVLVYKRISDLPSE